MKPLKSSKGFTLIELLVVIAIIAILAAILFPVFAQAREKAMQATCLSNLKQLGLAAHMYAQDYDQKFMGEWQAFRNGQCTTWWPCTAPNNLGWYTAPLNNPSLYGLNWAFEMQPYIKNVQLMVCPATRLSGWNPATSTDANSYVYNSDVGDSNWYYGQYSDALTEASIPKPSELIMFWDKGDTERVVEIQGWNGSNGCNRSPIPSNITGGGWCPMCYGDWVPPHNNGRNYLFCDGHAKFAPDGQMWDIEVPQDWYFYCQQ